MGQHVSERVNVSVQVLGEMGHLRALLLTHWVA